MTTSNFSNNLPQYRLQINGTAVVFLVYGRFMNRPYDRIFLILRSLLRSELPADDGNAP